MIVPVEELITAASDGAEVKVNVPPSVPEIVLVPPVQVGVVVNVASSCDKAVTDPIDDAEHIPPVV